MGFELLKRKSRLAIAIIIAGIFIIAVFLIFKLQKPTEPPSAPTAQNQEGQQPASSTPESAGGEIKPPTQKISPNVSPTAPKSAVIQTAAIVTPGRGEIWSLSKTHTIRWSHEGGSSGAIVLLDALSKSTVGWITPTISSQQVTYDWDTTFIALSRTNPSKKNILPGTYIVKVVFDGPRPAIESAPFTIVGTGTEKILTSAVYIRSNIFSPNFFAIKQGERVAIINDDDKTRTIKMSGVTVAALAPRDAYVFDTAGLATITYEFRMLENQTAKLTVTVEK